MGGHSSCVGLILGARLEQWAGRSGSQVATRDKHWGWAQGNLHTQNEVFVERRKSCPLKMGKPLQHCTGRLSLRGCLDLFQHRCRLFQRHEHPLKVVGGAVGTVVETGTHTRRMGVCNDELLCVSIRGTHPGRHMGARGPWGRGAASWCGSSASTPAADLQGCLLPQLTDNHREPPQG